MTDNLPAYFGSFDPNAQAEVDANSAAVSSWFKLVDGNNVIRILPPHPGMGNAVWTPAWQHFVPDLGSGKGGFVTCPAKQDRANRRECPICAKLLRMKVDGTAPEKEIQSKEAGLRYYANALELTVNPDTGAIRAKAGTSQTLQLSDSLRRKIWDSERVAGIAIKNKLVKRNQGNVHDFAHPEVGLNILATKGAGVGAAYWEVEFYPNAPVSLSDIEGLSPSWYMDLVDQSVQQQTLDDEHLMVLAELMEANLIEAASGSAAASAFQRGAAQQRNAAMRQAPPQQALPPAQKYTGGAAQQLQQPAPAAAPQGGGYGPSQNVFGKI